MKIGTNTIAFITSLDHPEPIDEVEVIRRLSALGYECLDLSLASPADPAFLLKGDDWQSRIDRIVNAAAKYGMTFSQVHLPYHRKGSPAADPNFKTPGFKDVFDEGMRRAYIAAGMAGAPWAVAHCMSLPVCSFDRDENKKFNHDYYDPYVELGIKNGVGTAFENLIQALPGSQSIRYCANPDDLIDYVDSYHDPMVGICWDFGHANIVGFDQTAALNKVGKRLKCTHVNDNHRVSDEHTIPFFGTVDWKSIIPVLAENGYEGDFSMEIGAVTRKLPLALQDSAGLTAFNACSLLRSMFLEAQS